MKIFRKRGLFCWACQILASIVAAMLIFNSAYGEAISSKPLIKYPEVDLVIDGNRVISIDGPINDSSAAEFIYDMNQKDNGKDPIYIIISSPGGKILSGLDMIKRMETSDSPVICVVDKYAASMAAIFAASCPVLVVHKYAVIMFHEYAGGMQGTRKELKSQMQVAEAIWNAIVKDMSKKMNLTEAEFRRRSAEDWWFNGYEAARMGFARAVVNKLKVKNTSERLFHTLMKVFSPERETE